MLAELFHCNPFSHKRPKWAMKIGTPNPAPTNRESSPFHPRHRVLADLLSSQSFTPVTRRAARLLRGCLGIGSPHRVVVNLQAALLEPPRDVPERELLLLLQHTYRLLVVREPAPTRLLHSLGQHLLRIRRKLFFCHNAPR